MRSLMQKPSMSMELDTGLATRAPESLALEEVAYSTHRDYRKLCQVYITLQACKHTESLDPGLKYALARISSEVNGLGSPRGAPMPKHTSVFFVFAIKYSILRKYCYNYVPFLLLSLYLNPKPQILSLLQSSFCCY